MFPVHRRVLRPTYSFWKIGLLLLLVMGVTGGTSALVHYLRTGAFLSGKSFSLVPGFSGVGVLLFPNVPVLLDPIKGVTFACPASGRRSLAGRVGDQTVRLECRVEGGRFLVSGSDREGERLVVMETDPRPKERPFRQIYAKSRREELNLSTQRAKDEIRVFGLLGAKEVASRIFRRSMDQKVMTVMETVDVKERRLFNHLIVSGGDRQRLVSGFLEDRRIDLSFERNIVGEVRISGSGFDGPMEVVLAGEKDRWTITGRWGGEPVDLSLK